MHEVFISYSRVQRATVDGTVEELERRDIPVWIDRSDIPEGVPWERQLRRAIRESDLVAFFVSDEWLESNACANEREIAAEYSKQVVAIRMRADEGFDPTEAAETIGRAYATLPDEAREWTDLESAAAIWLESDRRSKQLARGADLRRHRTIEAAKPVTDAAKAFIADSVVARRVRVLDRFLGIYLAFLIVFLVVVVPRGLARIEAEKGNAVTQLQEYAAIDAAAAYGPYQGLAAALAVPADAEHVDTFHYAWMLQRVTGVDVPIDRGQATEPRFAVFAFTSERRTVSSQLGVNAEVRAGTAGVDLADARNEANRARVTVPGSAKAGSFAPDGTALAVLTSTEVTLIDPRRGTAWRHLVGAELATADALAWSADGRQLGVRDTAAGVVTVWQVRSDTEILADTGLWLMDSTPLGTTGKVAFLGRDGAIAVVDASGSGKVSILRGILPSLVASHIAAAAGDVVYVLGELGNHEPAVFAVHLDTEQADSLAIPSGCKASTLAVNPAGDRVYLACGSRIVLLNPDGTVIDNVTTSVEQISALAVAGSGTVFAGSAGGGAVVPLTPNLKLADMQPDGFWACPGGAPRAIRATSDGRVAYGVGDGTGRGLCGRQVKYDDDLWDSHILPATGTSADQARGLGMSSDGKLVAVGFSDGTVQVVRTIDGFFGHRWNEQFGEVRGVEFTPDDSHLIVGTRDGLITRVPVLPDRIDGASLRERAQAMLDRATALGCTPGDGQSLTWVRADRRRTQRIHQLAQTGTGGGATNHPQRGKGIGGQGR